VSDAKLLLGRDAYDVIEHIAALPWCTGAVSMQGNSWLATTQWAAALEHPPSLKCIAPWEGFNDFYRGLIMRGGVPNTDFINFIFDRTIRGRNRMEDLAGAAKKWPLVNSYWADKRRECSGIQIPMYVVASYSSSIHSFGTYEAYMDAKSKDKWLRIHTTQEWIDLYQPENVNDLQKFYDRYLKGINNDWEATPRVRASLLTYGDRAGPVSIKLIFYC
jgi:predicted acyl esterase